MDRSSFEAIDKSNWLLPGHSTRVERIDVEGAPAWIVRDDLLHPLAGGNKLRKLDALLPQLLAESPDVVTCGGAQSAHAAAVAVACAERGGRAHLMLRGPRPDPLTGYGLVSEQFASTVNWVSRDRYADRDGLLRSAVANLADSGARAGTIAEGAAQPGALLGLIRLVRGLTLTLPDPFTTRYRLFIDAGTGVTAVGVAVGAALYGLKWEVYGIGLMPNHTASYQKTEKRLVAAANQAFGEGRLSSAVLWGERSKPRRFGEFFPEEVERSRQIARRTGVYFDPIYTLAAYDMVAAQKARKRDKCVLVHTGGTLNLFSIAQRAG